MAIPVKDRRERMLACLEAVLAQDHPSFEVLVLDNGSADGTAEACRARAATTEVPVRVEVVEGTLGRVRNQATRLAAGEVLAFTDSDCTPAPGWLRAGADALAADERLGVALGVTLPSEPVLRPWAHAVIVTEFSWRFETCNAFFRTRALRESDGFDEVVGDGWEDTAAGFAVLRAGWRAGFAPRALVSHDVTYPGFAWHLRREQRQGNVARIVRRYPEVRSRLLFAGCFLNPRSAACLLAALALPLSALDRRAVILAVPYVPYVLRGLTPVRMAQRVLYDAALHVAVLRGALRHRSFVL